MSHAKNGDAPTAIRYPKRKRAQIDYAEPVLEGEEEEDTEGESQDAEEISRSKKRKLAAERPLPKRKIFPFLQLPAEIRNEIYTLCLIDPAGIYLRSTTKIFRRTVYRVSGDDLVGEHDSECLHLDGDKGNDSDDSTNIDASSSADGHSNSDGEGFFNPNRSLKNQQGPTTDVAPLVPALLAVCKQINQEAGNMLYSHRFYVENPLTLHSFLVDIGPRAAALLKHIDMMEWSDGRGHKSYNHTCFTALMSATNLVSFNTHGYVRCERSAKFIGRQMYRDAFPWLEAVARVKGKTDAALEIFNIKCIGYDGLDEADGYKKEMRKLLNARVDRLK